MKLAILIVMGTFMCFSTHAGSPSKKNAQVVKAKERKPTQEINTFVFSEDYPKEVVGGNLNEEDTAILNPGQRDAVLARANLTRYTGSWDHLEKDILILRASKNSIQVLQKKYPTIPVGQLQVLQILLRMSK